jgi:hypothetical protein
MTLSERVAAQIAKLPPAMKALVDRQLAAGNEFIDVELGRGPDAGRVALVMNHPFRDPPPEPPEGLKYREFKDRDPMLFEYYTADEVWSLLTVKFKPMVFEKIQGPPPPPKQKPPPVIPTYVEEQPLAKRVAESRTASRPEPPKADYAPTEAAARFIASMTMTYDMWHDGLGYDLAALAQIPPERLGPIVSTLISQQPTDWRDIEALARIDLPEARAAVVAALKHSDPKVRHEAMRHAAEESKPADRERLLVQSLKGTDLYGGLSQAIDEAAEFHPPAVVKALLDGALNRPGEAAVHFAALLYFIHGKAKEPFDWSHRPFFLKFHTRDRAEREAVFTELCDTIGIDGSKFRCRL